MIRRARAEDSAEICALWNPIILQTQVTFSSIPKTQTDVVEVIAARPVFVAEQGDALVGFAYYFPFRGGDGYAYTVEHTIIVSPAAHGAGIGRALMVHLIDHARLAGMHSLWAGVSSENPAGVAFHARLGFAEVARLAQVGRKFDRWMDLVLMQKML